VVHQWNQPLAAISMTANNLKLDCVLDNIQKEASEHYADDILSQVKYLSKTVDDFRNFFKPSQDANMPYNLKEYIIKCVDLVGSSFYDNCIETISDIDEKINSYGNPNLFSQALINIFNNTKDALNSAKGIQEKLMFIVTVKEDDNDNIILTIKDNAGGIPQSIIGNVFNPYFTTKAEKGTGLGLYITHSIITKNLKGKIYVKNEEFEFEGKRYKGAKFVITLPLYI
jgi:signal transduction histidine kinase